MAETGTASILRRKTGQGRAGAVAPKGPPAPGRALADAFRRAAEVELQLAVTAPQPRERRETAEEIIEGLPEHAFLAVLIGPEDGAGLLALDPAALAAVIEMRTMGRVSPRPPTPRRPTQTDAAMVADVIDRALAEFEAPFLESEEARWAAGWRYQLHLPEPRPLSVVLDEAAYRVLDLSLVFGAAGKEGRAILALPLPGRGRPARPEVPPPESAAAVDAAVWAAALGETVEAAEAPLDAVLGRVRLTLGALTRLAPGDRLTLPLSALGGIRLVAPGGTAIADARLGQTGGLRAVKIRSADPRVFAAAAEGAVMRDGGGFVASGARGPRPGPDGMPAADPFDAPPPRHDDPDDLSRSAVVDIDRALNEPLPGLELLSGARRAGSAERA